MHLFISKKLKNFNFNCPWFGTLLQYQSNLVDKCNETVLMYLCHHNQHLLEYYWAEELVIR